MGRQTTQKRGYSLRARLTATVLVCWTVPILLIWQVSFRLSENNLRDRLNTSLQDGAAFAAQQVMSTLDTVIALSRRASADGVFYRQYLDELCGANPAGVFQDSKLSLNSTFTRSNEVIMAVLYYHGFEDSPVYYVDNRERAASEMPDYFRRGDRQGVMDAADRSGAYIAFHMADQRLYVIRNVLTPDTFEPYATLALLINPKTAALPFQHIGLTAHSYTLRLSDYLGRDELYLAGSVLEDEGLSAGGRLWRQDGITHHSRIFRTRDYMLAFHISASYADNFPELLYAQRLSIVLVLGVVPLLVYMLRFLHRQVTSPVQALTNVARRLEGEEFGIQTGSCGDSTEFRYLSNAFDQMSMRLRELFERSYREELMLRDARIEALQSQINPHFFNNTLELINWQARRNGDGITGRMVESLGTLVGAAIDRSHNPTVPLREEMEYVDAYLYITSVRYGKRLSVVREIDNALLNRPIPRLSLQPLLENAVVHGIENSNQASLVLRVFRGKGPDGEQHTIIEVENSGTLTEKDKTAIDGILLSCEAEPDETGRRRVGLANVYKRLLLLYNDTRVLTYRTDSQSTTFVLSLPLD